MSAQVLSQEKMEIKERLLHLSLRRSQTRGDLPRQHHHTWVSCAYAHPRNKKSGQAVAEKRYHWSRWSSSSITYGWSRATRCPGCQNEGRLYLWCPEEVPDLVPGELVFHFDITSWFTPPINWTSSWPKRASSCFPILLSLLNSPRGLFFFLFPTLKTELVLPAVFSGRGHDKVKGCHQDAEQTWVCQGFLEVARALQKVCQNQ